MGNVANITKQHIAGLNKALNKGEGLQCIHHNDDAGSPFSNPGANHPATVVIPPIKGFASTIFMIENTEQLVDFLNKLNLIGDYRQASRYAHEKFWPSCPQNLFASRNLY